jgi:hypothetical protein
LLDVSLGPEPCCWNGDGCIGRQGLLGVKCYQPNRPTRAGSPRSGRDPSRVSAGNGVRGGGGVGRLVPKRGQPRRPSGGAGGRGRRRRQLPRYDPSKPRERKTVVYVVKILPDGVRLAYNRDYQLLGSVCATSAEWDAALIHSLDTCAEYSVNDRVPGDALWFEVCGEAREPYRRSWIERREWGEEPKG